MGVYSDGFATLFTALGWRNGRGAGMNPSKATLPDVSGADYAFDWDDAKAESNTVKHGVEFLEAMTVMADPLTMTMFDDDHSENEERWVSIGCSAQGALLVVVHTFAATGERSALLRLISARPATRQERKQYEQGQ